MPSISAYASTTTSIPQKQANGLPTRLRNGQVGRILDISFWVGLLMLGWIPEAVLAQQKWAMVNDESSYVYSSPRLADLTGDGILDVIIGDGLDGMAEESTAMKETSQRSQNQSVGHIKAFDGETGQLLWKVTGNFEIYSSAMLYDITEDGVVDVFIGGRGALYYAVNGRTGEVIWQFDREHNPPFRGWLQFYTSQLIPDQNGDGFRDILVTNGGYPKSPPGNPDRPPGRLLVLDARTGQVLANAVTPDSAEAYYAAQVLRFTPDGPLEVVFGTGGETLPGGLWRVPLSEVLNNDISRAIALVDNEYKGFMAPSVIADYNRDGTMDVLGINFEGKLQLISGADNQMLWEYPVPNAEIYTTPAIGFFNDDEYPDIYAAMNLGIFPNYDHAFEVAIDGKTGKPFYSRFIPPHISSPLALNLDDDPQDEVLLIENPKEAELFALPKEEDSLNVRYYDFQTREFYDLTPPMHGLNYASTPWIGDMDGDRMLELIYAHISVSKVYRGGPIWVLSRIDLDFPLPNQNYWGGYLGLDNNGIFRPGPLRD